MIMLTRCLGLGLAGLLLMAAPRLPPEQPVNLNTATLTELLQLPRVGPRTAERILAFRQDHGPFQRPEELMNVKGIGEKAFLRLRPHILVDRAGPVRENGPVATREDEKSQLPRRPRAPRGRP
jgi:competence protein ComEA